MGKSFVTRADVAAYADEVVAQLGKLLGEDLVGVYLGGSVALGDYVPGRSDVDVLVVCRTALPRARKVAVAEALRHESLPCPARGLELVLYRETSVRVASAAAGFELNLNSGARMPFHVSFDPSEEPRFWFVLDRSITRERGIGLHGPSAKDLFAPIPRPAILGALAEALAWHRRDAAARAEDTVLNGCRAWRYAEENVWSSKTDAGHWARMRLEDPGVAEAALALRVGSRQGQLAPPSVTAFVDRVAAAVVRARLE